MEGPTSPGTHPDLREHALELLQGPHAHLPFEEGVLGFPLKLQGTRTPGATHTAWEILEHMRIAQHDILAFCRTPEHESPEWPSGYWPQGSIPPDEGAWDRSARAFLADRAAFERWVHDPGCDLLAAVPDEEGPTLLHEIAILSAHNAYHLGQIVQIRRALGA
jgi:hypothetical protein